MTSISDTGSTITLPKGVLRILQGFWVITQIIFIGFMVISIQPRIEETIQPCQTGNCKDGVLTQKQADDLSTAGISMEAYAYTQLAVELITFIVYTGMGILIFWNRSNDLIGLVIALALSQFGFVIPGIAFALEEEAAWFFAAVSALAPIGFIGMSLFYPDGKFRPRWLRIPVILLGVILAISIPLSYLGPFTEFSGNVISPLLIFIVVGLGVYSQVYKFRQSEDGTSARQQYKWALYGVVSFLFTILLSFPALVFQEQIAAWLDNSMPLTIYNIFIVPPMIWVLPITLAISIMRFRLWNIDIVINRTLVYGLITLFILLVFGFSFFALTSLTSSLANGGLIAIAISAAVFGASFQPLRRNLQRFVDQRFYGIQIDYQRTPTPLHRYSDAQDTRFGSFTHLELVGRGGMAEVYRATPDGETQPVALKILPPELAHDPDYRKRFEREVQVMLSLQHDHIVQVIDFGEEQGQPYIVMEFIQGRDLSEHLGRVGRLSPAQTLDILSGVAAAMDFAHSKGLIHRDIKPSNVMLDQRGLTARPVLMDFGIAKILGRSLMTNSGFLGTLDYISPEQIQGEDDISYHADIYSLGAMTYQMLAGEMPFVKRNPGALLLAHISQPAPDIRDVQPELSAAIAAAIQRAMSKQPEKRFESAAEFVAALDI